LQLRHDLIGDRTRLDARSLLTHQAIYHIQYLIAQTGLTQCSHASRQSKRPQHRQCNNTDSANSRFIQPALLSHHCQHATCSTLQGQRKSRLHANNCLKISTLLQLYEYLIFIANLLRLVSLNLIRANEIISKSLNIYLF
jgi:hypothetical protein